MNIHQNARLTPFGRGRLVERVLAGQPVGEVARAFGVSERTVYKWLSRWRAEGPGGLQDRSSRPRRSPRRLRRRKRRQIVALRRRRWSSTRIARELGIPVSTVGVMLRRLRLNRLQRLAPPRPVIRYERSRPGELLHLDTKKLGKIGRVGHRIHGNRRTRVRGIGWEVLHVCVDDATRLGYSEVLPDELGVTAAGFFRRAAQWFSARGIRVERVMTDNGSPYRSKIFARALGSFGARHIRTRPYTPQTNGKAERFIQTSLREWAYARPYATSRERAAALEVWLRFYNRERPHMGIRGRSPQQRWRELMNNVLANHN